MLLNILHKQLVRYRQNVLIQEIAEVRREFAQENIQFGTVSDFLAELDD
jgi:predicted HAD superfamily Cof-like phosphohydrolase